MSEAFESNEVDEVIVRFKSGVYNSLMNLAPDLLGQADVLRDSYALINPITGVLEMHTDEEILKMLPGVVEEIEAAADAYKKAATDRRAITVTLKTRTDAIRAARARLKTALEA